MELESIVKRYELASQQIEDLAKLFSLKQFAPGEKVFREGDHSETFYFIKAGELEVSKYTEIRRETVLAVRGPGEFLGEIGLLRDIPRTATITALTHVQLYELQKDDFLTF